MQRILLGCAAMLAASVPAQGQSTGARGTIPGWDAAVARKVEHTLMTGDAAGLAALYTDDAIDIESGQSPWVGKAAIEKADADFLKENKVSSMRVNTLEFQSDGKLGWERGEYTMVFTPKGGNPTTDHSRYLIIWKRQKDGHWKIHRFLGSPVAR